MQDLRNDTDLFFRQALPKTPSSRLSNTLCNSQDCFSKPSTGTLKDSNTYAPVMYACFFPPRLLYANYISQLRALLTLGKVCDTLAGLSHPETLSTVQLEDMVQEACHSSLLPDKNIVLLRGVATTPLVGIDVPFHSTYLQGGIDIYRKYLQTKVREQDIAVDQLVGKWIPNVVGRPFSVDRTYMEEVVKITGSAPLQRLLGVEVH
jgi:hypothetical protein